MREAFPLFIFLNQFSIFVPNTEAKNVDFTQFFPRKKLFVPSNTKISKTSIVLLSRFKNVIKT